MTERDTLTALIEKWRAQGRHIDSFHATMGSGYKACADELAAALAVSPDTVTIPKPLYEAYRQDSELLDRLQDEFPTLREGALAVSPQPHQDCTEGYGNARCKCGHLSCRHNVYHRDGNDECHDCDCEAFCTPRKGAVSPQHEKEEKKEDTRQMPPVNPETDRISASAAGKAANDA